MNDVKRNVKKRYVAIGMIVVAVIGLGVLYWTMRPRDLTKILREDFDMVELAPPEDQTIPGTIVKVTKRDKGTRLSLAPVCWRTQAYPGLVDPKPARTLSLTLLESSSRELGKARVRDLRAKAKDLSNISLSLTNAQLLRYSEADLSTHQCAQVNEKSGPFYVVMGVLRANIAYTLKTRQGGSIGASELKALG